jgi:hypothetical protein
MVAATTSLLPTDRHSELLRAIAPLIKQMLLETNSPNQETSLKLLFYHRRSSANGKRSADEVQIWDCPSHKQVYSYSRGDVKKPARLTGITDAILRERVDQAICVTRKEIEQAWTFLQNSNRDCLNLVLKFKSCRMVGVEWVVNRKIWSPDEEL